MPAPTAAPASSLATSVGTTADTTPEVAKTPGPAAVTAPNNGGPSPDSNFSPAAGAGVPTTSPTVVTDSNIRENTIPAVTNAAAVATKPAATPFKAGQTVINGVVTGTPTGQTANPTNTDSGNTNTGTDTTDTDYSDIYSKILGEENAQPLDPLTQQNINLIESTKSSTDASYNTQIDGIHTQYAQLQALRQTAANTQQAETRYAGARTGMGSSTTGSILDAETTANLNQMASLTNSENTAVANIQSAMAKEDYQSAQDEITALEKVQSDRAALADKVATSLVAQNTALQKTVTQAQHDTNIVNAFNSGITDPADILKQLNANGGDYTLAEINTALTDMASQQDKNISELTGDTKNFYELQKMGALPSSITSLPADKQLQAYLGMTSASTASTKALFTGSGGTVVTQNDISSGVTGLENSGTSAQATNPATGKPYANPATYEDMYNTWVGEGLEPQDFVKTYPAAAYLDPNDISTLPPYLQPQNIAVLQTEDTASSSPSAAGVGF